MQVWWVLRKPDDLQKLHAKGTETNYVSADASILTDELLDQLAKKCFRKCVKGEEDIWFGKKKGLIIDDFSVIDRYKQAA